jgi:SAM-dependent methyltransferase
LKRLGPETQAPSANDLAVSEHDVDLIAARLRDELSAAGGADVDGDRTRWTARAHAERFWAVTADRPFLYRPSLWGRIRGTLLIPAKVVLRKSIRWYVEPALAQQRDFNSSLLKALDQLNERVDTVSSKLNERVGTAFEQLQQTDVRADERAAETDRSVEVLKRKATEADERLVRVERRVRRAEAAGPPPAPTSSPQPQTSARPADVPDYFAFEARMRGSRELVRERQAPYVSDFRDAAPVLDLGCGRGEFLELLREEGIEAKGIDLDADMVEQCREEGLEVEQADAVAYVEALEDGSLGGIFCSHVAEHLAPSALFRLLELAASKLRSGGILIAETPNPKALVALSMFFADLTHLRPLDPETFAFLARQAGFREVETRFLHEPPAEERLQPVRLPDKPEYESARAALTKDIDRINEVVFGPQDFALVARA